MATEEVDLLGGPDGIPQSEYISIGSEKYKTINLYLPSLIESKKLESHWKRLGGLSSEIHILNEIINTSPVVYSQMLNEFNLNVVENNSFMMIEQVFQRSNFSLQIKVILKELVQMVNIYKIKQMHINSINSIFPDRCEFFCDISYVQILSLFVTGFLCAAKYSTELSEILSFDFLCPALLEAPKIGIQVICYMTINRPECFNDIVKSLVNNGDNNIKSGRINTLYNLAQLSKYAASTIRDECVTSQVFPEVIFRITLEILHDEASFITSFISSYQNNDYIISYFTSVPEPKIAQELRSALWNKINKAKDDNVAVYEVLRTLCVVHWGLRIPETEIEEKSFIPNLIHRTNDIEVHKLLFACLYLWPNSRKEIIGPCIKELSATEKIPQMFLLAAVLLHTDKEAQLCEYIESILDFPMGIIATSKHISQGFVHALTKEILPIDECCVRALKLPHVTEDTPPAVAEATFRTFRVLLEQNLFSKYKVDAGSWLVPQILSGGLPAHPLFIDTISSYAGAAVRQRVREEQGQEHHRWRPTIISEEEARRVLGMPHAPMRKCRGLISLPLSCGLSQPKVSPHSMSTRIIKPLRENEAYGEGARYLVALFVLEYSEAWTEQKSGLNCTYLDDFLWNIPIREILSDARSDPRCVGILTTRLSALAMSQFPHHVDPELLLIHSIGNIETKTETPQFSNKNKTSDNSLSGNESEEELELYTSRWLKNFARDPWSLSLEFINSGAGRTMPRIFTHADIITDLTIVLRAVDRKALRSPNLISIVLSILKMYRSVARKMLAEQEALQPQRSAEIQTFVTAQDTALIQLLLEACLEHNTVLPPSSGPGALMAVRALVCNFVHHLFIEDPSLITIIHTQGYNEDLIPVTVHGIPSVYLCQDFLPTLLARPSLDDKIFAAKLGVALAYEYKTEQLYKVMGIIIESIHDFHKTPFKGDPMSFLEKSIPLLPLLLKAFPCYKENVLLVLNDLLDVATSDVYTNIDLIRIIKKTINEINTH